MKKTSILAILLVLSCLSFPTFSQGVENTENNLHIIPQSSENNDAFAEEMVWKVSWTNWDKKWSLIDRYNEAAKAIDEKWDIWVSFKTWIMSRDSLIKYIVYLMRFINQLGLLIWSLMILYAGYQYAWVIFKYWDPTKGKTAIKNAVIWILVIIFSYAIWRGLEQMFL